MPPHLWPPSALPSSRSRDTPLPKYQHTLEITGSQSTSNITGTRSPSLASPSLLLRPKLRNSRLLTSPLATAHRRLPLLSRHTKTSSSKKVDSPTKNSRKDSFSGIETTASPSTAAQISSQLPMISKQIPPNTVMTFSSTLIKFRLWMLTSRPSRLVSQTSFPTLPRSSRLALKHGF